MKTRIASFILALSLVLSLGTSAFAAEEAPETPAEIAEEVSETLDMEPETEESSPAAAAPEAIGVPVSGESVASPAASADWRQAYLDYVIRDYNGLMADHGMEPDTRYNFMYVDSSGIPWLLIFRGTTADGCALCYMYGSSMRVWPNQPMYYEYAEGSDAFFATHYASSATTTMLYVVRNGEVELISTSGYGSSPSWNDYFWENENVTRATYESRMNALRAQYMTGGPIRTLDYYGGYTYDQIIAQLKNGGVTSHKSGWQREDDGWCYYKNGSKVTGWLQDGGKWYWLDSAGCMAMGWRTIEGKRYCFTGSGVMLTGWQLIDGSWYYFNSDGSLVTSNWASDKSGWYFMGPDGKMMEGLSEIALGRADDGWYYFNPEHDGSYGRVLTGWQQIGGVWYYFNPKHDGTFGRMVRGGWVSDKTGWYFMDADGEMMEGLSRIALGRADDGLYYFNPKHDGSYGRVLTGWRYIDGIWYYFNPNHDGTWGRAYDNGWNKIGGKYYYFYSDGAMAVNTTIDGWYVDSDGVRKGRYIPEYEWKAAYNNFIRTEAQYWDSNRKNRTRFYFMNISENGVPMLYIELETYAAGGMKCYYDGELVRSEHTSMVGFTYGECSNLFLESWSKMGAYMDTFWRWDGQTMTKLAYGDYAGRSGIGGTGIEDDTGSTSVNTYHWNGKTVSRATYLANYNKYINQMKAISGDVTEKWYNGYTYSQALSYLQ